MGPGGEQTVVMTGAGVHHHHRAWPAIASMITAKLIYGF
jgi:hypothetical protein